MLRWGQHIATKNKHCTSIRCNYQSILQPQISVALEHNFRFDPRDLVAIKFSTCNNIKVYYNCQKRLQLTPTFASPPRVLVALSIQHLQRLSNFMQHKKTVAIVRPNATDVNVVAVLPHNCNQNQVYCNHFSPLQYRPPNATELCNILKTVVLKACIATIFQNGCNTTISSNQIFGVAIQRRCICPKTLQCCQHLMAKR